MNITEIRVKKIEGQEKMKGVVSVTFDNDIVVHDIKIIDSKNGLFVAMPSRKAMDGSYKDVVHPINSGAREQLHNAIMTEYHKASAT